VNGELGARNVDAALEGLGNPEDLASEYMTDARAGAGGSEPLTDSNPRELVPLGKSQRGWILCAHQLAGRIFPGSSAHSVRCAETNTSTKRRIVEPPRQQR